MLEWVGFCETRIFAHALLKQNIMTTQFLTHIKDCISSLQALRVFGIVFFFFFEESYSF